MSKVLILEPDTVLAKAYAAALQKSGHEVQITRDAQDAILAIDKSIPEVVVLEPQLAVHSGIEFLQELRSYREWQKIPVIINSFIPPKRLSDFTIRQLGIASALYKPATSLKKLIAAVELAVVA